MDVTMLKRQHEEITAVANRLASAITCDQPQPVGPVRWQLARQLMAHLAVEDRIFYPAVERHGDPEARATADRFVNEMGGLSATFSNYMTSWSDDRIARDWQGFRRDTLGILGALKQRVDREDRLLYPLMERIDTRVRRCA